MKMVPVKMGELVYRVWQRALVILSLDQNFNKVVFSFQ